MKHFTIDEMDQMIAANPNIGQGFCDAFDAVSYAAEDGEPAIGAKTTIGELAAMKAGIITGKVGIPRFDEVAKLYPNVEIYTAYFGARNLVGSCDMYIDSDEMGNKIEELTGLRYDDAGKSFPGWRYFEAE